MGVLVLGTTQRYRPKSVTICVLLGATQNELQSNMQMAGIYTGLGSEVPRRDQAMNQDLLPLLLGLVLLSERCRSCRGQMLLV